MTNQAQKKDKRHGISEELKLGVWNVRGICHKEEELQKELKQADIDIAIIPETKKKLKGSVELEDYIMLYSGVPQNKRASAGIAILLKKKWKTKIQNYEFINERLMKLRYKTPRGPMTIIGCYAPEEGRLEDTNEFYDQLQTILDKTNKNDYIIIAGDLNARIGNIPIGKIIGTNGEPTININGNILRNFALYNTLKITNTFFRHKDIHKYTWSARGSRTIIDYVIVNEKVSKLVEDTRVYRGYDVGTDHFLLISRISIPSRWKQIKRNINEPKQTFKVHLLQEESILQLYQKRLNQYIDERPISNNINSGVR